MSSVDICLCTFRRPHLAQTLQSLAQLKVPADTRISVIVADNDEIPGAKDLVANIARDYPFPIRYLHAPARNISIARNACLDTATAPFVAFIDDDECASPDWLLALLAQQNKNKAEAVLGPVQSRYPDTCAAWLRNGDFHSIKPVWVKDRIVTGYTSNVLLWRGSAVVRDLRFDLRFGRTGGEDTFFFSALHKKGGVIDYAQDAVVTEKVAAERLTFPWLLKRSFRSGQTHGALLLTRIKTPWVSSPASLVLAFAKALFCMLAALGNLVTTGRMHFWLLRGTFHLGVVARLLGLAELKQYG